MTTLDAIGFRDEHRAGNSYYIVSTPEGEREYEYGSQIQLSCIRHIYPALDDYTGFTFTDKNGVLVITPKGEEPEPGISLFQLLDFITKPNA